jgi:hypothetical protein
MGNWGRSRELLRRPCGLFGWIRAAESPDAVTIFQLGAPSGNGTYPSRLPRISPSSSFCHISALTWPFAAHTASDQEFDNDDMAASFVGNF